MMFSLLRRLGAPLFALSLLTAACGGSTETTPPPETTPATAAPAAATASGEPTFESLSARMTASDRTLAQSVKAAIAADSQLANVPIEVTANEGVVHLHSGQTTEAQRQRAVEVARGVNGVTGVEDWMK